MKAIVTEACIGCGLCVSACPQVFRMDGVVAVATEAEIPSDVQECAAGARDGCPVSAIDLQCE